MQMQIWVQGMDDGSDGSFPDGIHKPVSTETLTSHWRMGSFGGLMELNPMMQTKTSNWYMRLGMTSLYLKHQTIVFGGKQETQEHLWLREFTM